jgi:membrane-associated protease RseP (regulator of RpoE activity)
MLAILSVLIIVHECGHFSVARFFGFQTPVFGFGLPFGPHIVVGRKWGTEFRVHACLLGGYVAIPELGDESNQDVFGLPLQPFRKFPIWQRALVAFAGVGFNILFAYLIMLAMLFTLGHPSQPTMVYDLVKDNPIAARAGIRKDDEIVAIDNQKVTSSNDAVSRLVVHKSEEVTIEVKRDNKPLVFKMTTNADGKVGMALGPGPVFYQKIEGNFFEIALAAAKDLWTFGTRMLETLGQLVAGLFSAGKSTSGHPAIGWQDLHGILAVVIMGADIAKHDWSQLFLFTILISLDLAIINLLPWPALDGGHLAFMAFEAVRGKPMEERAQGEIVKWGFVSLIVLITVIMVNDITALFRGKLDLKSGKEDSSRQETLKSEKTGAKSDNIDVRGDTDKDAHGGNAAAPSAP